MEHIPFVLINATDGGGDHKNTSIQNQAAQLSLVILFDLHTNISTRNALGGSYINAIERVMCVLNLGLQHMSWARDKCMDKDVKKTVSSCSSMSALREKGKYHSIIKKLERFN